MTRGKIHFYFLTLDTKKATDPYYKLYVRN